MITFTMLVNIFVIYFFTSDAFNHLKRFQNGAGIRSSTANIVDFTDARRFDKTIDKAGYIVGVNVVTHLFTAISINLVKTTCKANLHQVT